MRPRKPTASPRPAGMSRRSSAVPSAALRRCWASRRTWAGNRTWARSCPSYTKRRNKAVRLSDIADIDSDSEVTGFAIDHRKVARGSVFGAFKGAVFDGEDFIPQAVSRGAVAVVARPEAKVEAVPHLADPEPRRLFAGLAAQFFAPYPDTVVAVTGTNGKTSTVEMTRQIWRMTGHRSASIGTLGVTTSDDQVKTGLTTPDIVTFLSNVAGLKRMGMSHVAYEASSHGLDQHRAEGVPLAAAGVTKFSPDPPRYHPAVENSFQT